MKIYYSKAPRFPNAQEAALKNAPPVTLLHVGCRKPFMSRDMGGWWGMPSRRQERALVKHGILFFKRETHDGSRWFEFR